LELVKARKLHQLLHPSLKLKSLLQMAKKLSPRGATLMNQITELDQDTQCCFNRLSKHSGFSDLDQPMCISTNQKLMLVVFRPVDYNLNYKCELRLR
jgi:hypothetical protein